MAQICVIMGVRATVSSTITAAAAERSPQQRERGGRVRVGAHLATMGVRARRVLYPEGGVLDRRPEVIEVEGACRAEFEVVLSDGGEIAVMFLWRLRRRKKHTRCSSQFTSMYSDTGRNYGL